MTDRNFKKELCYSSYIDMKYGNDTQTIDYDCLIGIITELVDRIEQLEKVNKEKLSLLKTVERGERVHNEMEETIKIHDGYGVVDYQPTPQTPEQVADGLKEAFREAVKQGVVSSTKSKTLTDLIYRWWGDVFTTHSDWDMETSIEDLVDQIELWLPKEQSAAGSQNHYVECTVEGFNDCLTKIKGKLR